MTRKSFLGLALGAGRSWSQGSPAAAQPEKSAGGGPKLAVFSKHLQWLDIAAAADFAREAGFDAMDLTVRPGGHVEPQSAKTGLPRAAELIRERGLELAMITTAIQRADAPETGTILDACRACGVRYYRWGGWKYDRARKMSWQLDEFRAEARKLAIESERRGLCGIYHTHSGRSDFGASIWDILAVLEGLPAEHLGLNFDIGHATIEGGLGGWINSTVRSGPYLRGIAIKDFIWARNARGQWLPQWTPIGEGMVRLVEFLQLTPTFGGPIQIHFEYPLGGAEHGGAKITWTREQVMFAMRRDVTRVRAAWTSARADGPRVG